MKKCPGCGAFMERLDSVALPKYIEPEGAAKQQDHPNVMSLSEILEVTAYRCPKCQRIDLYSE
jgi:hypothetical protein